MRTRIDRLTTLAPPQSRLPEVSSDRDRQIQETMTGGALGVGMLLAGFGVLPALFGAAVGATLGYLFERRAGR